MTAAFIVPFDHRPTDSDSTTTTFTVPVGKYARAVVSYGLSVLPAIDNTELAFTGAITNFNAVMHPAHESGSLEYWLKAGDTIALSTSVAGGTAAVAFTSVTGLLIDHNSKTSSVTVTINNGSGVDTVATIICTGGASFSAIGSSVSVTGNYSTFTGSADAVIRYELYNVIS